MKTLIVIPTYNEVENITTLLQGIFAYDVAVLVVDDNSPDGTADAVRMLEQTYPALELHMRDKKSGIGSAYIYGFQKALRENYEYVFEMDADLSHDPKHIPEMLHQAQQGCDVVIGSRRVSGGAIVGWNIRRRLMSWGAMELSRLLLGLKTKDITGGYRCYRTSLFQNIDLATIKSNGYAFQEEMLYYAEKGGAQVCEIPITFVDRRYGKSKLSSGEIIQFFVTIIRLKFFSRRSRI